MKVVRLSALRTGRLYPTVKFPGYRLSRPQGHSAAGRIKSINNPNYSIGNRSPDLPANSAVPQPTALQRTPSIPGLSVENGQFSLCLTKQNNTNTYGRVEVCLHGLLGIGPK